MQEEETVTTSEESGTIESAHSTETETTTTTAVTFPCEEHITQIRYDLDLIAGLLVAFIVIELCKWSYRFLNMFFPDL